MEQKMTNQIERPIGEKFVDPSIGAIVEVCLGGNCLDCVYCKTSMKIMPEYECMKGKEVGYCHKRPSIGHCRIAKTLVKDECGKFLRNNCISWPLFVRVSGT